MLIAPGSNVRVGGGGGRSFGSAIDVASSDPQRATVSDGFNNAFTGNLDWQRINELVERQEQYNAMQAEKAWERSMYASNTSIQRAVADLKKAGLNPALAATSSLAASSPTSAMAQSSLGSYSTPTAGVTAILGIISSVLSGVFNLGGMLGSASMRAMK